MKDITKEDVFVLHEIAVLQMTVFAISGKFVYIYSISLYKRNSSGKSCSEKTKMFRFRP